MCKWTYEGNPEVNDRDNAFDPADLVTTLSGNIIIADENNNALHVLSDKGVSLKYLKTKDLNIIFPQSLHIDIKGRLWIGCDTYGGQSDAMIHVLKFKG